MGLETLLTHLVDILLVCANIALVVTVFILASQNRTQNNVTSIKFCRELLDKIQKNNTLRNTNNEINNNSDNDCNIKDIDLLLNEYEDLAYFWRQKIVKLSHIKEIHGAILSKIKKSKKCQNYINQKRDEDKFFFSSIVKLLKKID